MLNSLKLVPLLITCDVIYVETFETIWLAYCLPSFSLTWATCMLSLIANIKILQILLAAKVFFSKWHTQASGYHAFCAILVRKRGQL